MFVCQCCESDRTVSHVFADSSIFADYYDHYSCKKYYCEISPVALLFATVQTLMTTMKAASCSGTFVSVDSVIKQTEVLSGLSWLWRRRATFSLFFLRCDDETGGPNNDKERFAR